MFKEFKNYFIPVWIELDNGKYRLIGNSDKVELKYNKINTRSDLVIIDDKYSSDLHHIAVANAFNDIFNKDDKSEINKLLHILKQKL